MLKVIVYFMLNFSAELVNRDHTDIFQQGICLIIASLSFNLHLLKHFGFLECQYPAYNHYYSSNE
jgi:hypothetical protein